MMADIADKVGLLILFCDNEDMDIAEQSSTVQFTLDKLEWLIIKRGILTTGYTKFAMESYKQVRIYNVKRNVTVTFGSPEGVPAHVVDDCFGHWKAWLKLAKAVC